MSTNASPKRQLIHEALSRTRTRRPQVDHTPEAYRSARRITAGARHQAARELGGRPF